MAIHEIWVHVSGRLRNTVTSRKAEANHEVTPYSEIFWVSLNNGKDADVSKYHKTFFFKVKHFLGCLTLKLKALEVWNLEKCLSKHSSAWTWEKRNAVYRNVANILPIDIASRFKRLECFEVPYNNLKSFQNTHDKHRPKQVQCARAVISKY